MVASSDLRWRAIMLVYIYSIPHQSVARILGISVRSIKRWYSFFEKHGSVEDNIERSIHQRWPDEIYEFIGSYLKDHPCFYLEELQVELRNRFPSVRNFSVSTICRALRFDLNLTHLYLLTQLYLKLRLNETNL